MDLQFPPATPDDLPLLLEMMEAFYAIDGYAFKRSVAEKALAVFLSDPGLGRIWLIREDGELAGYLALTFGYSFEFHGRNAFLDELYLKESFRGRGIGGKALAFALTQARALGIDAVHLEVERHNEAGKRLYRRHGFRDHDRHLMTCWVHGGEHA